MIRLAAEVASRDYRFEPVRLHELADVALDLSLLTIPRPLEDARDLVIGRDGLIVEHRGRRGLLLPQVATEHGWDRETFLAHACIKAGLARDAWRDGARLFCFEAEVIGDNETREMP